MSNIVKITLDLDTEIGRQTFINIGLAAGADVQKERIAPLILPEEPVQTAAADDPKQPEKKARAKKEKVDPANLEVKDAVTVTADASEEVAEEENTNTVAEDNSPTPTITLDYLREQTAKKAVNNRPAIVEKLSQLGGAKNVASLSPEYYKEYSDYLDTLKA